ncbi:hypothetical protein [Actinomadura macrotermitis]|uniref:Uncharacterized protein n=1 Tax=Actinomadura macrotermitis TaxID=2585200 RepID=A0A7K0BV12_9ACTN|nr:hypothetical protein [Actinomadura macrotermitis]MQY04993.1 hypothetical protein [Actinomadura macrotermitis]
MRHLAYAGLRREGLPLVSVTGDYSRKQVTVRLRRGTCPQVLGGDLQWCIGLAS